MKMNSNTPDQKEALDTIRAAINGSRTGDAVQACLCVAAMKAVDQIEAALQAAQVEKVEGLAEALSEFDSLPEQDTTSLIILKAARLQLARQESLSTAVKGEK